MRKFLGILLITLIEERKTKLALVYHKEGPQHGFVAVLDSLWPRCVQSMASAYNICTRLISMSPTALYYLCFDTLIEVYEAI